MARLIFVLFLFITIPVFAQTETTENLLPDISEFTTEGGTVSGAARGCAAGAFCTSGTSGGGGFFRSTFDVPLTREEVNAGFDLTYGANITSHPSNVTVPSCVTLTQGRDCKDVFDINVSLFDSGTAVETFQNRVELDFAGLRNFSFTSSVNANQYGTLTGQYEFFGIDAGFASGFFGPRISDPALSITFTPIDVLLQEQVILDVIDNNLVQPQNVEPVQIANIAPIQPITPIEAPASQSVDVGEDLSADSVAGDAELEQTSNSEAEEITEPVQAEPEPEPVETPQPEEQEEPETREAEEGEESNEPTQVANKPKAKVQAKTKATKQSKIKYNPAIQTRAIMAMVASAPQLQDTKFLSDVSGFFNNAKLPDSQLPIDYRSQYSWIGQSNGQHEALKNSQWGN